MKGSKILITGGDKSLRMRLAETIRSGCQQQGVCTLVHDLEKDDAIISVDIPKTTEAAIFVAGCEGKKFAGIYERLIRASQDKLSFVHIEVK